MKNDAFNELGGNKIIQYAVRVIRTFGKLEQVRYPSGSMESGGEESQEVVIKLRDGNVVAETHFLEEDQFY